MEGTKIAAIFANRQTEECAMLSINGIYDGKQIIPTEPVPLKEGKAEPDPTKWDLSKICGAWQDDRDAEEIINEIYRGKREF